TLAFNARLPVLLGASPFYRTPASPIAHGLSLSEVDYVKARLTAMAVETDEFTRDDIYTLFITTRIINFLKGQPLTSSANLTDLLDRPWTEPRTRIGFELLKTLAETGRLYFWTKQGLVENKKFKPEIVGRVLSEAGQIACQNGNTISVGKFARRFPEGCSTFRPTPEETSLSSRGNARDLKEISRLSPKREFLAALETTQEY
ncbi:MAG TPA: hypothetical protein VE689_09215, partial [Candidatus Udaeobacter sp.]|nr:hypothetical protein [Candidatus Udaeobacter sp.]